MPQVSAFRGIEYALERFATDQVPDRIRLPEEPPPSAGHRVADLTDLVCPPYDVISPQEQAVLLARDDRNAIRLELPDASDPHAAASATLAALLREGTLARRDEERAYYYSHATPRQPDEPTVHGVLARLRLEPFGADIRAHEHTMPGPKAERLAHLRATRTQFSPILAVYFDHSERYQHAMSRPWTDEWRARDADGLLHAVAVVEPDDRLLGYLARQRIYIADGHHRYETALAYQAEVRSDPRWADAAEGSLAADWIMVVLVNAEREELEIQATHRLLFGIDANVVRGLLDANPLWQVLPVAPGELSSRLHELRDAEEPVFGLVLPGDDAWLLVGDLEAIADRMRRERSSTAVRRLDLAVLHAAILSDRLGIDAGGVAAGDRLAYTRSEAEARAAVARGEASAAILVRPTRLEQLAEVASVGDVMPQKSTYFYPKLLTGFVLNPLED